VYRFCRCFREGERGLLMHSNTCQAQDVLYSCYIVLTPKLFIEGDLPERSKGSD
jgi:hypothetical protein